jgi:hypothetical protein
VLAIGLLALAAAICGGEIMTDRTKPTRIPKVGRDRRLRPRYGIEVMARATIQLFGSTDTYELITENISETGVLLRGETKIIHLTASSILEVSLFVEGGNPIKFLGKWARNATDFSIGIAISEISIVDRRRLAEFMDTIQHNLVE